MATLGERLKLLRGEKKIKAEDVAAAIGVKRRIIFEYEKNESKPSYKAL